MNWAGVMPAMTTPFDSNGAVDHAFLAQHAAWLLGNGCTGLVVLGSLGEGATLEYDEKVEALKTVIRAAKGKAPVVAAISSLSTAASVKLAKHAEQLGCEGLLVLPPYVYSTDWREMKQHVSAIIAATRLSCMIYNNPVSYGTDFVPEQIAELAAEHANLHAVKESSTDVRRVSAIRALLGNRLEVFVGVDDAIYEGVAAGATGWIAGLVNAFPAESVELFNLARARKLDEAFDLYRWFLPLLRMDTVPKLVQLIKWVQGQRGVGSANVRAPRLEIVGAELAEAQQVLRTALANRPKINEVPISNFKGA
ncbi:dihydrodipicolinate synthase family protein [Edaphobacter sp.]|uniref:dihydrodipicolinate synthase family protein n=1 Tax=Edaphobacter sp. TaxID=1934404 RepID=UPI002DB81694|nr:dihydrodipicolinate synthase family protein [Edaphobacter sp.]HEU5342282.1 dihydrodipicolinate synthase family protein [Edaphobacter sp.]